MCRGEGNTNTAVEQKTESKQLNVINTQLTENETANTIAVTGEPPLVQNENIREAGRIERVRQIQVKAVPELTIPEKTLFDDYLTLYEDQNRRKTIVKPQEEFATSYKEKSISENKRSQKAKNPKSRLYRKAENARQIEDAGETELKRETRLLSEASENLTLRLKEEDTLMLTKLMTGDKAHDRALLERYSGDQAEKEELMLQLIEEFLHLDLTGYDLSNDETIARNSADFESLNARVDAMLMLVEKNPAFFNALPKEVQASLKTQRKNAAMVVSYYRLTKMIVTDPYYRTHYNSEISRQWSPTDEPAKQRLSRLLWMRTGVASHPFDGKFWKDRPVEILMDDTGAVKKKQQKYRELYWGVVSGDGEFAKSGDYDDTTNPHFQYFRQLENNDPVLYDKITSQFPTLAGTDIHMKEPIVRTTTRALESMRGIRNLTEAHLTEMLNNIYAVPKKNASPEEIEETKQQNISGLRVYKQIVGEQLHYIDRKYPFLHEFATADEVKDHKFDIQDDLCMIQIMIEFMKMIQKIPELYDPENAEDRYMFHTLSAFMYLQATERFAGGTFDPKGKGAGKTLVGTRMSQAMDVMMFGINDADYGLIKLLDKLENDDPSVKWDEEIIYSPLKNEEPVLISKTIEKMERKIAKDSKSKKASRATNTLKDQDFSTGLSSPKTSDLMKNVKTTYFTIDQKLKEPIPDNETLFNRTVEEIREIYIELIRSCTLYEEKRNPWTDLGKKRKEMVHTIRMNALSEMDNLGINADKYFKSGKGGTYGDIIGDKQRDRALINGDLY